MQPTQAISYGWAVSQLSAYVLEAQSLLQSSLLVAHSSGQLLSVLK